MSTTKSNDFMDTMGDWFAKFPELPKNGRDTLARIVPILSLIFGILGILVGISGLGVIAFFSPLAVLGGAAGVANYGTGFIASLFYLAASILMLASYPGLKAKKYNGWKLLFWSEAVYVVGGLISMSIISTIIGALITFYLLFQIKSYYK